MIYNISLIKYKYRPLVKAEKNSSRYLVTFFRQEKSTWDRKGQNKKFLSYQFPKVHSM